MALLVICSYMPKAGHGQGLKDIMAEHVPALQKLGLATPRAPFHGEARDGVMIEVFEWVSEEASRSAHDHPEVKRIWGLFAEVCDFVSLAALPEAQRPFAHFKT